MNKLWLRLALSFLLMTWLILGAVALLIEASVESSFTEYVQQSNAARFGAEQIEAIEAYYADQRSWEGVGQFLERGHGQDVPAERQGRGAQFFIADTDGMVVAATNSAWVGINAGEIEPKRTLDLVVDGQNVGSLGEQTPGTLTLNQAEQRFLEDIRQWLLRAAIVGTIAAFGVGIVVSYGLTRPLQHLADQIGRWRMQAAAPPITSRGTDEVQRLAQTFNQLLEHLREEEQLRQRMTADVAHELRTPVTVMRGQLEAMMDGIYPLDTNHLGIAYNQTLHLARLVEDMRLLTQAESGHLPLHRAPLQPEKLIGQVVEQFIPLAQDSEVTFSVDIPETLPPVCVDQHRLHQVFDNLLSNALRHTPSGGQIRIRAAVESATLQILICNQGSTLTEEQIAHLFDRFWRAEESRERDLGGSGLGLAITRELLRLHGGQITAQSTSEGVCFTFTLPASG